MDNRKLKKEFEYIRNTFFPQWDRKREWSIKRVWHLPSHGKYDNVSKRILIQFISGDRIDLYRLLIHEICHCVSDYHGKRFLDRLLRAKLRANELGLKMVANAIQNDIDMCTKNREPFDNTYQMIEDAVMDIPNISWRNLLKYVARQRGRYPKEFLKRYKRAKKVFLSAKKFWKEEREARIKFEKIIQMKGDEKEWRNV
jgi:hypothetical protein